MRLSWRSIGTLAALAALGAVGWWVFRPPPVEVDVAQVVRGPLEVTVAEDGKTRIRERYIVSAPLAGELLRVGLRAGDDVRAGETLLAAIEPGDPSLLDSRARAEADARVKAAEARGWHARAQLDRARATAEFARSELARAEKLLPSKAMSEEGYEAAAHAMRTATDDVRAAEYGVQIAEFEQQQAQAALTRTHGQADDDGRFEIRSPIQGKVLRVFQESSATIAAGTRLIELGDPTDLEIEVDVLSSDAVRISTGARVYLEHWGATAPLVAQVRMIEPQAFLKVSALGVEEQRVNVIADFVDPPSERQRLGDGYRVEARIVVWEAQDVLKTNAGGLFRQHGQWAVFRLVDGRIRTTPVTIGQSNGLETEITGGLNEHDQIVAYPSDQVADGVRTLRREDSR